LALWRFALMRLRYLCLLIFFRRFLTSEPMQETSFCVLGDRFRRRRRRAGVHKVG
jgi:hypothetical protein